MDDYTIIHNETYKSSTEKEGYEKVYVAVEEGECTNYEDMIYAAKDPSQSIRCLKNPNMVCLFLVSMNTKNMGYMPIAAPNEYDTYVNDMRRPTIFIARHMDIEPLELWVMQKRTNHKKS